MHATRRKQANPDEAHNIVLGCACLGTCVFRGRIDGQCSRCFTEGIARTEKPRTPPKQPITHHRKNCMKNWLALRVAGAYAHSALAPMPRAGCSACHVCTVPGAFYRPREPGDRERRRHGAAWRSRASESLSPRSDRLDAYGEGDRGAMPNRVFGLITQQPHSILHLNKWPSMSPRERSCERTVVQ